MLKSDYKRPVFSAGDTMAFQFIQSLLDAQSPGPSTHPGTPVDDNPELDGESDIELDIELDLPDPRDNSDELSDPDSDTDTAVDGTGDNANVDRRWSDQFSSVQVAPFIQRNPVNHSLDNNSRPFDFFTLFIPDHIYELLATQSNLYAQYRQDKDGKVDKNWKPVTVQEIKLFLYINIMFGIHKLPQIPTYWSTDQLLRVPAVADVGISRNRYNKISQYLHLSDSTAYIPRNEPGHDPLFKIRPLIDTVLQKCRENFNPGRAISFDEAMISFKGRIYFKQYIKGKPNPWGIKVWCAADAATGYLLDFSFYTGKSNAPMPHGIGHHVIWNLGQRFFQSHHLFCYDNYFSSVQLAEDLLKEDTYSCSTVRDGRKGWPAACSKKQKIPKGTATMRQTGNLVACLWNDKRPVTILSTTSDPVCNTATRKAKGGPIEKQIPQAVLHYNDNMGGVDLSDQLRSYYPIGRKSKKWWRCGLWFLFEVSAVNAYIVYLNTPRPDTSKPMQHYQFQLEIARELLRGNSSSRRSATEYPTGAGTAKPDILEHTLARIPGRKKQCFQCRIRKTKTATNRGVETVYGCMLCKVHLCQGLCFAEFHHQLN